MVACDEIDAGRRQHEKSAVDDGAVAARLFGKGGDRIAGALQRAISARRGDGADGCKLAVPVMKLDRRLDVDVAEAVAIGEAERLFTLDELGDALQAATGHGVLAGVDSRHP